MILISALVFVLGGNLISVPIMYLYSLQQETLWSPTLKVTFPSGRSTWEKDWYPLVLTSAAPGIQRSMEQKTQMRICYSFGAYEGIRSGFYYSDSKYFLSFYGCYIIDLEENNSALFREDAWNETLLERIATYDLDVLVLSSLGCNHKDSTYEIKARSKGHFLAGLEGWSRFDAKVNTRSPDHQMTRFYPAYLQYGVPPGKTEVNFPKVILEGRMYARYFPEESVYVLFFILGKDETFIQETVDRFILPARISYPDQS